MEVIKEEFILSQSCEEEEGENRDVVINDIQGYHRHDSVHKYLPSQTTSEEGLSLSPTFVKKEEDLEEGDVNVHSLEDDEDEDTDVEPVRKKFKLTIENSTISYSSERIPGKNNQTRYICDYCPFETTSNSARLKTHLKLHVEGSKAVPCEECGRYLRPTLTGIRNHHLVCPGRPTIAQRKKLKQSRGSEVPNEKIEDPLAVTPSLFLDEDDCEKAVQKGEIENDDGKKLLRKLTDPNPTKRNQKYRYRSKKLQSGRRNKTSMLTTGSYYYKCFKCPFRAKVGSVFEAHLKLHEKGSKAVPCADCGTLYLPEILAFHKRHGNCQEKLEAHATFMKLNASSTSQLEAESEDTNSDSDVDEDERKIIKDHKKHEGNEGISQSASEVTVPKVKIEDPLAPSLFLDEEDRDEDNPSLFLDEDDWEKAEQEGDDDVETPARKRNPPLFYKNRKYVRIKMPSSDPQTKSTSYYYKCFECPFREQARQKFAAHLKLHESGSKAVPCEDCGTLYTSDTLIFHQCKRDCQQRLEAHAAFMKLNSESSFQLEEESGEDKNAGANPEYKKKEKISQSVAQGSGAPAPASQNKTVRKGNKSYYKCSQCGYLQAEREKYEVHLKLHEEGSRAVPCEECEALFLPENLFRHKQRRHGQNKRISLLNVGKRQQKPAAGVVPIIMGGFFSGLQRTSNC